MIFRRIKIIDKNNCAIYDGLIYKLPLKEEAIQDKYQEIYKEYCECQKRKEVVKGMLYMALDDYFQQFAEGTVFEIHQIPKELRDLLDFYENETTLTGDIF